MKKPLAFLALLLLLFSAGFIACQKYSSATKPSTTGNPFPPEVMVNASVQGRVVDQDGVPVAGATVSSGASGTTTDINGIFTFKNISLSSRFGYVQASKSGYFTGSRSIATDGGQSSFVTIQLITRTETGHFPASTGGKITVYTGDSVSFGPGAVVTASTNTAYTGTVHVFATYLNPTNNDLTKYMPGDLRGITTEGKEVALRTYGMMDVQLQDDAGNKLQLAAGQQATITVTIPDALQAPAPATIPLWYFNDTTGRWIQQGTATRQGNVYVGAVGHFSWWNYDVIYVPHNFKAYVKDQNGNPLSYLHAVLYGKYNDPLTSVYTDSAGYIKGWMPDGEACVLKLVTECGNILAGANVGPAIYDLDLGTITVTMPQMGLTLTGKVVDCSNSPVANGFVNAYIDGLDYRAAVTNGKFTLPITRCYTGNATAQLTAGDLTANQQGSTTTTGNLQTGTVDVGTLSACGITTNQFMTVTFNGNTYTQTADNQLHYSSGNFFCSNPYMGFSLPGLSGTGNYTPNGFYLYSSTPTNVRLGAAPDNTLKCNISNFGAVNQYITGTLSGNVYDSVSKASYPLTGSFKYLRTN